MRRLMTICAFAAAAVAGPALAASSDYYLKLGDVKGEIASAGPGHQIAITSWSWGATGDWDGTIKGAASAGKYGAVGGMHRDESLSSRPLDRGAVRVKVKFPWLDCKVGAAFPDAVLQNDAGRYELKEAIITGCAPDAVSLNYAKVRVRGWDPEKKE